MTDKQTLQEELKECEMQVEKLQDSITKMRENKTSFVLQKMYSQQKTSSTRFRIRRQLKGHYGKVYSLQWSICNPATLVSASQDGKIIVLSHKTKQHPFFYFFTFFLIQCLAMNLQTHTHP